MADNVVVIEVRAEYHDGISAGLRRSESSLSRFDNIVSRTQNMLDRLGMTNTRINLDANDRASHVVSRVGDMLKSIGGRVFQATVGIIDKATAPLRWITNQIFSLKGLITGIMGGVAFNKLVQGPIALADQLETASIGFETMFNDAEKAQAMMTKIQDFAAKTPFDTTGVISSVQQMMRTGIWDENTVMDAMESIGNAAAAAGQGTAGVQGIVLALQQMSMAGKLNAQDINCIVSVTGNSGKNKPCEPMEKGCASTVRRLRQEMAA